ncbi:MAG: glycosyltransferase 87 family protein [Eubacteriales bacterium]|nr:glycosyltransferase 87 family protein [Eubacteriales bacterium]
MRWEERLQQHLIRRILWYAFGAVFLLGAFVRWSCLPQLAADLQYMNMSWYTAIKQGGMAAVLAPDLQWTYSPMHLYVWALAARLFPTADDILVLKGVSLLMEAGLVLCACLLVWQVLTPKHRPLGLFAAFALLWLNPVLVLNASLWGQTDASYVALSLLSLWLILKGRPGWAMVSFGLAIAFKLQAVFLLPLLLVVWFLTEKKFSLMWFLLIPAVWAVTGIPMALLGESPLYAVTVYLGQTSLYVKPTYNCPNFYALLGDALGTKQMVQGIWQRIGLALAVGALGGMAVWLLLKRARLSGRLALLLGAWCVLACIFFLPRMHERYGLAGEVLLALWAVTLWKPRGFLWVLWGLFPTVSAYCEYLFRAPIFSLQLGGAMNLALLCVLTWELIRDVREGAMLAASQGTPWLDTAPAPADWL